MATYRSIPRLRGLVPHAYQARQRKVRDDSCDRGDLRRAIDGITWDSFQTALNLNMSPSDLHLPAVRPNIGVNGVPVNNGSWSEGTEVSLFCPYTTTSTDSGLNPTRNDRAV